jgi:Terpene synthase family 2, C-terminal metal binding
MTDSRTDPVQDVPEIFCPFPFAVNPHVESPREHLADWVRRTGLVSGESARVRFEQADFGWFVAMVHPTADLTRLNLVTDWFAWMFLVDDQLDDGAIGRSPQEFRQIVATMRAVLEAPEPGAHTDAAWPSVVSSLADLWSRTTAYSTPTWRRRFVRHLELCLSTAAVWETDNRVRGIVPDEATYIRNRRHTGAIYVCMDLVDIVSDLDIPDALHADPRFAAALDSACDVVCWTNDVYSLEKERSLGEVHNLVCVVQHHRDLTEAQAVVHVREAISARTRAFLTEEAALLRAHPEHRVVLVPAVAGMRSWMRGNLDWSSQTQRYRPPAGTATAAPEEYLEAGLMRR